MCVCEAMRLAPVYMGSKGSGKQSIAGGRRNGERE